MQTFLEPLLKPWFPIQQKVALCFIISYEHVLHHETLWREWIEPNKDIINVYVHYKNKALIRSPWLSAYCIPPNSIQQTSYYNVAPAYISLFHFAFHEDITNRWFCILSDTCVPVISPEVFRAHFFKNMYRSYLAHRPAYWDVMIHQRANLRHLNPEYHLANDPWFILTRSHVHKCIIYTSVMRSNAQLIISGGLANESLFAIILKTFRTHDGSATLLNTPNEVVNQSSTVCDWLHMSSPTSPYFFKTGNETEMKEIFRLFRENKESIVFLRKVHRDFPADTIRKLWKEEHRRENVKVDSVFTSNFVGLGLRPKLRLRKNDVAVLWMAAFGLLCLLLAMYGYWLCFTG